MDEKETLVEKMKNFLNNQISELKAEIKRPRFWVSSGLCIFGVVSTVVAARKVANVKRENQLLKKENEKLGKQVNEAWYQAGKLQQQVVNNNNK